MAKIAFEAEDNGKVMEFYKAPVRLETVANLSLWSRGIGSDYQFNYGNAIYSISKFNFYDPEGRVYSMPCGYFEHESSRYNGVGFKTDQEMLKRLKLTEDFDWGKAHNDGLLFFISRGKAERHEKPKAEVYIPFDYLRSLGFEVTSSKEGNAGKLVTPMFFTGITCNYLGKVVY